MEKNRGWRRYDEQKQTKETKIVDRRKETLVSSLSSVQSSVGGAINEHKEKMSPLKTPKAPKNSIGAVVPNEYEGPHIGLWVTRGIEV